MGGGSIISGHGIAQTGQKRAETHADSRPTICFPFTGDSIGGSHYSLLGLIKNLDHERYHIIIVPQYPGGAIAKLFSEFEIVTQAGLNWQDYEPGQRIGMKKFLSNIGNIPAQIRFLRKHNVKIVHSNDGRTHATWGLAARLSGAKLLWHHRADPTAIGLNYLAPIIANRILTVSEFAMPKARFFSGAHKAQIVHSPFDTDFSVDRNAARQQLVDDENLPENALFVGFFGGFINRKRPLLFLDMVRSLRDKMSGRPVIGLMFGKAETAEMDRAIAEKIIHLGLQENIRLMGWRTPGAFWIGACDQLIIPAIGEPFGRTLVEAMLVGTPVIATRSGGNIEALRNGENGILVPPENADALADAAVTLANDPEMTETFVKMAQDDSRTRFGEKIHSDLVSQSYEQLLHS